MSATAGERIFRMLLSVYPTDFRERFGEEMVEFFRERRTDQYRRGHGTARLWMHLVADIAMNAPVVHLYGLAHRGSSRAARESSLWLLGASVPWSSPNYPNEIRPMESLWQDIRFAARTLTRKPAFAAVAILTLALGIGATTAIYSVADAVLIQPLPWPSSNRLVAVNEMLGGQQQQGVVYLDYADWRANSHSFDLLGVYRGQSVNLTGGDAPERLFGTFVNGDGLALLGASVSHGRLFSEAETKADVKQPVAVIADGFWKSHFAGSADAIGKTIVLNGEPLTIVGVLRQGFQGAQGTPDVWMPIAYYPNKGDLTTRGRPGVSVLARLKPGMTIETATADLASINERLAETYPTTNKGLGVGLVDLKQSLVGSSASQVYLVLAAVFVVLLIACANVANLQLARASTRRQELTVRSALGAGRYRLLRQLLTESLLLSVAGGVVGVFVAYAGVKWLGNSVPNFLQFFGTIQLNPTVLAFAALVTISTGFFFALPPAWRSSRVRLAESLTVRSGRTPNGARGLVFAQTALCVVMLVTAGLLTRSLVALTRANPGFDANHVLTMQFRLPAARYDTDDKIAAAFTAMIDEIRGLPGVTSAALVRATPLNGNGDMSPYQLDGVAPADPKHPPMLNLNLVSSGYYETMRIPRLSGRDFTAGDGAGAEPVTIVNRQLAEKVAPGGTAVGKRIQIPDGKGLKWFTIVGVVDNARQFAISEHQLDQAYLSYLQHPLIFTEVVVRASGDPATLGSAAQKAIWRIDRDQPVWRIRPLATSIGNALGGRAFVLRLLAAFASLAVILAMIGIYGVTSYAVAGRVQEMGIRLALGARATQVVGLVVKQSMSTIVLAILVGLAASVGVTRLIQTQLFGVGAGDPIVFAVVPLSLALIALLASWIPARRASRVDPVKSLRAD